MKLSLSLCCFGSSSTLIHLSAVAKRRSLSQDYPEMGEGLRVRVCVCVWIHVADKMCIPVGRFSIVSKQPSFQRCNTRPKKDPILLMKTEAETER